MKKHIILVISFTLFILSSCGTSSFDKTLNEAYNEARYVSSLSNDIIEETITTWSTAIRDNKDSHGDYCSDFNRAIRTLYADFRDASILDSVEFHYSRMEALAKELSDCPSSRKEVFDELVVLVSEVKNHYKKAMEPSGNLQQFSQETRLEYSSIEKTLSQFEIKHSNILSEVNNMPKPSARMMLLDFEIHKAEIKAAKSAENKAAQKKFLEENKTKEGIVELPSGLQIKTIKEGTGKRPKENSYVLVNYKGTLIDGSIFDSNNNIEFNLYGVINGFREGLLNMKEGGKSILYIPSELGYGDKGSGDIPGGTLLIFEVELLKVNK